MMKKLIVSFLCLVFMVGFNPLQAYVPNEKGTFGDWKLFIDCCQTPYLSATTKTAVNDKEILLHIQIEKTQPWEDWVVKYDIHIDNQPILNTPITLSFSFADGSQKTISGSSAMQIPNPSFYFKDQTSSTIIFNDKNLGSVSATYSLAGFNEAFAALEKAQKEFEQKQKK